MFARSIFFSFREKKKKERPTLSLFPLLIPKHFFPRIVDCSFETRKGVYLKKTKTKNVFYNDGNGVLFYGMECCNKSYFIFILFFLSFFGVNPNVRFSRKQFLKETLFESVSISRVYILHVLSMMYIIINIMAWRVY